MNNNNMIYLPSDFINNNYQYFFNSHDVVVYTNNNCYQNYNTTYCDCYRIQTDNHYLHSDSYSCSYNTNYPINKNNLTDDFYYRNDIMDICVVVLIILLVGFGLPIKLFSRFFRRLH